MRLSTFGMGAVAAFSIATSALANPDEVVLRDSLEGPHFTEAGGLYYKENYEQSAGTFEFQQGVGRNGKGALKLTIRPLCPTREDGCSERAEIWEKPKLRVPYDEGVWYGFAVKFADPIPQDDHRYLVAQWKREIDPGAEGDFSPFLALRLRNGKLFATVETNYVEQGATERAAQACDGKNAPVWLRPETNQMRALVATDPSWTPKDAEIYASCTSAIQVIDHGNKLPAPSSGWIDFAVYTKPGPDGAGHIELFANGRPIVTVKGHIGHADPGLGPNQYFKFGPYRAANSGEWTLYYDDFRRSPHCKDVLTAATCPNP